MQSFENKAPAKKICLEINSLVKQYNVKTAWTQPSRVLQAVNGVSFKVEKGHTQSIIGESGCGKTTVAKMILGMEQPTSGEVIFEGIQISGANRPKSLRRRIQLVFQNPYSSLNPRKRVIDILNEPLVIHDPVALKANEDSALHALQKVGLNRDSLRKYPHMFSGGQRQRIAVARSIIASPELLVLDEPVSALDLSVQAQVLNLLKDLQTELGLTYLFISHDISVVRSFSHQTLVMYFGQIMESGLTELVLDHPVHPYTQALVDSTPTIMRKRRGVHPVLPGEIPSPLHPPSGCPFHTRCPLKVEKCTLVKPGLELKQGRLVACHQV